VIHTVGPIAQGGVGEVQRSALRSCYKNSLKTATENAARSVAFPCISTGIYGYPPEKAVHEALATVREYLEEHHDKVSSLSSFSVSLSVSTALYHLPERVLTMLLLVPGSPESLQQYQSTDALDRVIFCVFLPTDKELYLQNLPLYFPAGELSCFCSLTEKHTHTLAYIQQ
ncbi:hypothetical protein INR49_024525, partial [Caranx melampygus]